MRQGRTLSLAGILCAATATSAAAQMPQQVCAATASALPGELAGWALPKPLAAASVASGLARAPLTVGEAVSATLTRTADIHYVVRPEKPGGSVSYGGMFGFTIRQPGTYRVALGSAAWIDLVRGKTAIVSTAHGHGPECSGIRKMVDFSLAPGRYVLQIGANGEANLPLMLAKLP